MSSASAWLPDPGEHVGRYEILAPLARGGMSAVYVARLPSLAGVEKLFALKVPLPHCQDEDGSLSMFLDEARIAVRIEHPNVAQIFELGEEHGRPYIVMELVSGHSLSALVKRARARIGGLPREIYFRIVADAARGLHAAHEAKGPEGDPLLVVHRDISPQNLHIGYEGRPKIVDFGIARARGRITKTESGTIKGKFRYLAPEQVASGEIDLRTDLWALGVMLWEFCAQKSLLRSDDEAGTLWNVMHKEIPPLRREASDVPEELDRIVMACLQRDKLKRPRTALELADVLDVLAAGTDSDRVALVMNELFRDERAAAEERLRTPVRKKKSAADEAGSVATHSRARVRRRRYWLVGAFAMLAIAGGLAFAAAIPGGNARGPRAERPPAVVAEPPHAVAPVNAQTAIGSVEEPSAPTKVEPPRSRVRRVSRVRRDRDHERSEAERGGAIKRGVWGGSPPRSDRPAPSQGTKRSSPLLDNPYQR